MCGRFTRYQPIDVLGEYFGVPLAQEAASDPRFAPSLDCAPGLLQPVVCQNETGERSLDLMRWGFSLAIQGRMKLVFNTKAEGVLESRLWKQHFSSTRCIVPATSFFEWPGKIKTEIALRNEAILGFAGLWATWTNPRTQQQEPAFSIFTTEPNPAMRRIHNRQPVILERRDFSEWLTAAERAPIHLLRIAPEERMIMHPASSTTPGLFPF